MEPFTASDLPIMPDGRVYHLNVRPRELAPDILIVGDPGRAEMIGEKYFDDVEVNVEHRGLRTVTGKAEQTGQRISVVTSGMGTPSLEIVANEIIALNEIDFSTRTYKEEHPGTNIIRVGTSGGLQEDTPLGTSVISEYAVGLDNTCFFYEAAPGEQGESSVLAIEETIRETINEAIPSHYRFKDKIFPYAVKADEDLTAALIRSAEDLGVPYKEGIIVSSAGFFNNQGRANSKGQTVSRLPLTVENIDGLLASLGEVVDGLKVENMEMEASTLFYIFSRPKRRAAAICPAIANRRSDEMDTDYQDKVELATKAAIHALWATRKDNF